MKKVLLTSTALVAFAGAAAAEVSISGWAEMGVAGGSGNDAEFFQDVDVDFDMSGETDNGLTFGASVDLDEAGNLGNTFSNQGVAIFLSGEFGTVTLGDTDSAFSWAVGNIANWGDPGSIADDETAHFGYQEDFLTGRYYDGQVLRYDYTYEDFGFAVSVEQDDRSDYELDQAGEDGRDDYQWAIGGSYSPELGAGVLDVGIGYEWAPSAAIGFSINDTTTAAIASDLGFVFEDPDWADGLTDDEIALLDLFGFDPAESTSENDAITVFLGDEVSAFGGSIGYTMDNGFSVGAIYTQFDGKDLKDGSYWGVGAGYAFDAFSIHANYGKHDFEGDAGGELKAEGWGLAAGYDLGGGLSILGGYGWSQIKASYGDASFKDDFDTYSFGLSMSF